MKPLFIPLNSAPYEQFASGEKDEELRRYGPRWNEQTCHIGRQVTLSKGYGKQHRMHGVIARFKKQHASTFGSTYRAAVMEIYGTLDIQIAVIFITNIQPAEANHGC